MDINNAAADIATVAPKTADVSIKSAEEESNNIAMNSVEEEISIAMAMTNSADVSNLSAG